MSEKLNKTKLLHTFQNRLDGWISHNRLKASSTSYTPNAQRLSSLCNETTNSYLKVGKDELTKCGYPITPDLTDLTNSQVTFSFIAINKRFAHVDVIVSGTGAYINGISSKALKALLKSERNKAPSALEEEKGTKGTCCYGKDTDKKLHHVKIGNLLMEQAICQVITAYPTVTTITLNALSNTDGEQLNKWYYRLGFNLDESIPDSWGTGPTLAKLEACVSYCPFTANIDDLINQWGTNEYRTLPDGQGGGLLIPAPTVPDLPL